MAFTPYTERAKAGTAESRVAPAPVRPKGPAKVAAPVKAKAPAKTNGQANGQATAKGRVVKEVKVLKTKAEADATFSQADGRLAEFCSRFLRNEMAVAAKEFGNPDICVASEAGRLVIGLPLPSFCWEYLTQNSVWPLGRVVQLVGLQGSCKSGLGFEIDRWFLDNRGIATLLEHESKYSPDWALSIIGWENGDRLGHVPCHSVNEWQQRLQWSYARVKQMMVPKKEKGKPARKGLGPVFPFNVTVDSLVGKLTAKSQTKIEEEGSASRSWSEEALIITPFLKAIPQKICQWPFGLVTVNHLKMGVDAFTQTPVRNKAGGKAMDFQETYELELKKLGKTKQKGDRNYIDLRIRCMKNSLGVTDRQIPVKVYFWDERLEPENPQSPYRQRTVWDWHGATIELLLGATLSDPEKKRRKDVVDLVTVKGKKGLAIASSRLGISKKAPLPFYKAGEVLCQNTDVLHELRQAFGVKIRRVFQPGISYRQQVDDETRKIATKLR